MAKQVADIIVEMLVDAGIKRIYAVTGDSLNFVNDAIHENGKIQWIHVRHEETGAFAAGAEAQLHGNLACCAGSSGPGHVHLINGLYDAHRSGAPVIALATTMPNEELGTGYFQETNTIKLFDDCSCYNQLASNPQQLARILQCGMQHAISKKGVAVVGLPGDVASMKPQDILSSESVFPTSPTVRPIQEEIEKLADLLNEADKITLFCGMGAKDAHMEMIQLAGLLKSPVVYSFKSKMEIQYNNPYEVGLNGLLGLASGYESLNDADVIVMLGTDFPYSSFMPTDNKIVQVDINPANIGRRVKVDMGLCGDVKTTLQALLPLIKSKKSDAFLTKQLKRYKEVKGDLNQYVENMGKEDKLHPEYVMSVIDALASNDAIFTVDTGMTCVWGARYLNATGERRMLGSFNHGTMANAMPQSIGASLAYPGRQVIALCGDGGLSMMLGDLQTIVQYNLPVKVFIFNNRSLGMVKLEMEVAGIPFWQTDMLNPDFAMIAKAMGMVGFTVNKPEELKATIRAALKYEGPVLVNIMTDPNTLAMPPKVEWNQMTGFAKAMYKMLMNGDFRDIKDTIASNIKHIKEVL